MPYVLNVIMSSDFMSERVTLFVLLLFIYCVLPNNCYVSSNCVFNAIKENDTYNFSRLTRQDAWMTQIRSGGFAHISLCHPIASSPCKNSTFCVSKQADGSWDVVISNNGPYQLQSKDNGRKFELELSGIQKCDSAGGNYSVKFFFTCSSIDGDPIVLGLENNECLLLVMWETTAACPVIRECVHGDYDLSSLSVPTYYIITTYDGKMFELNLCQRVNNSSRCYSNNTIATACEIIVKDNITKIIGQFDKQTLTVVQNVGLTLKYTTKSKGPKTEITFNCNPDAKNSTPSFVRTIGKTYYFEVETPLVCNVWPKECLTFNRKRGRFDLKPLRKTEGNWVVQSTTPGVQYYINVCGPLNPIQDYATKTDGGLEACLIYMRNNTVVNLGTVAGGPSVVENVLTLQYTGGSPCPSGGRHKAKIEFSCSNKSEGSPVYIETTKDCVHIFSWETTVACPILDYSTKLDIGKNCKVEELQYGHKYDLSVLRSGFDEIKSADQDSYRVNLCGPLQNLCNNKNSTVCLQRNGKEIAIGYDSTTIYYENGGLTLITQGEPCKENFNRSTVKITLLCRHGDDIGSPEFPIQEGCDFYFVWYTNAACPPRTFTPCTVGYKDNFYDLSPLTETTSNHVVIHRNQNLMFSINVCHSVVFGTSAMCEYTSGACMLNMSDLNPTTRFTNIGDVENGPYIDSDKKLKLKYEQGKICNFPSGPDHISTIITFECAEEDSVPIALPGDVCVYEFLWRTKAACPLKELKESHGPKNDDCTAVDPVTQDRFDLRSLQNKVHTVSDSDGHNYTFVVCGNLTNSSCGIDSGVCQEKMDGGHEHWNAGVGSSRLQYRPHALLLEYKDGSPCTKNMKRSTTIEFVCADEASEQIVFIEEVKNCSYLISWHTTLACNSNLYENCFISGKHSGEVDLASLIRRDKNYVVKMDENTVFFINICRSLLPVQRLGCSEGSSICMAHVKDGNFYDEKNIGFYGKLEKKNVGRVSVIYNNEPDSNATAEINLECDLASGIGELQFQNIMENSNQTKYNFLWKTNMTCEPHEVTVSPQKDNCVIHNDQLERSLNLRELGHRGVIEVDGNLKYVVDFCGSILAKQRTKDGLLSNLYGTLTKVTFYYQQRQASLHFTGGSACNLSEKSESESQLLLNCIPGIGYKNPVAFKENDCNVVIEWQNPLICELLIAGYPRHVPHIEEKKAEGSSVGLVIGLVILAVVLCSLFVYFRKPSNRSQLRIRLRSLLGMRHSGQFHYSRLEAADEASQLLVSHMDGQESDSDDELLRM